MEKIRLLRPARELRELAEDARFANTVGALRRDAAYWKEHFHDTPDDVCGWSHNYVCPDCGGYLAFDREKPLNHYCPACGKDAPNTALILESWTNSRRNDIAAGLNAAALVAQIDGDSAYEQFVLDAIGWYAKHYIEFPEHGLYAGRGRIMGQSLTEASWAVSLLRALSVMRFDGSSSTGQELHRLLFLPLSRLVQAQSQLIHNIPLWQMTCAVGAALIFNDERLYQQATGGVLGARNQVLQGFTPDGMWFENATGYHFYALEAATQLCIFLMEAGRDEQDIYERTLGAYLAPGKLLLRGGTLPATNDCTGSVVLSSRANSYLRAARLFDGLPGAGELATMACELAGRAGGKAADGEFLYGIPRTASDRTAHDAVSGKSLSLLLPHNHIAVIRNDQIEAVVKYGNLSASHAHPDALELLIPPFALDPGTTGYGSNLHRKWYTKTAAHATFAVNGASQSRTAKGDAELDADGFGLTACVNDAYEDVTAKRRCRIEGDTLTDRLDVTCGSPSQIDWFFHAAGEFRAECESRAVTVPGDIEGGEWFESALLCDAPYAFTWTVGDRKLRLLLDVDTQARVFVAISPDNPGHLRRRSVIVRVDGAAAASFKAAYTILLGQ